MQNEKCKLQNVKCKAAGPVPLSFCTFHFAFFILHSFRGLLFILLSRPLLEVFLWPTRAAAERWSAAAGIFDGSPRLRPSQAPRRGL
jgi:hypothetical protein